MAMIEESYSLCLHSEKRIAPPTSHATSKEAYIQPTCQTPLIHPFIANQQILTPQHSTLPPLTTTFLPQ